MEKNPYNWLGRWWYHMKNERLWGEGNSFIIIIIIIMCLLAGPWTCGRENVFFPFIHVINCHFPLFLIFSFFLFSPIFSIVFQVFKGLLPSSFYSFDSCHFPLVASWRIQFLPRIRNMLFKSVLFSPIRSRSTSCFLWSFYLLKSSPAPYSEALKIKKE